MINNSITTYKSKIVNNKKYRQLGYGGPFDRGLRNEFNSLSKRYNKPTSPNTTSSSGEIGLNAAVVAGNLAGPLIAGDLESGAGSTISSLGDFIGFIPGPWGAVAGAGLKVLGGLATRAFGSKLNDGNVSSVENNTNALNSVMSNASNFEALNNAISNAPTALNFDDSYIGKDGWFSNKASSKANSLRMNQENAENRMNKAFLDNSKQLNKNQLGLLEANYSAFGGYLGGNGTDFNIGMRQVNNGDTHENNPNGGVPMGVSKDGTQNLVEEGETIYNDYVFSNRLKVPKALRSKYKLGGNKDISFAEASKKLSKEAEERPNDPISRRGLETILSELQGVQEEEKAKDLFSKLTPEEKIELMHLLQQQAQQQAQIDSNSINQEQIDSLQEDYVENANQQEGIQKFAEGGLLDNSQIQYDEFGNPLKTYGHQGNTYNLGWYDSNGNYTDDYRNKVNNLSLEQLQKQFDDQQNFYYDTKNKGTQRWNSIDQFYARNKEYKTKGYKVNNDDLINTKRLALDNKPGYMHYLALSAANQPTTPPTSTTPTQRNALTKYWLTGQKDTNGTPLPDILLEDYDPNSKKYNYLRTNKTVDGNTDITNHYYNILNQPNREDNIKLASQGNPNKLNTWMRYAPIAGLGIASITDALGITNKPDYSNANALLNAHKDAGKYMPVSWNPVGNYLKYSPFDREFQINKLNSQSGATRRALLQNAGLNRGAGMSSLLASDFNTQNQLGQLARQAEEYNLAQRQQVENFNRQTNSINSEGFLKADIANQNALANSRSMGLNATLQGIQMRERAKAMADQSRSVNLSNLINSIGDLGKENMAWNWRNFGIASGLYGPIQDNFLEYLSKYTHKKESDNGKKGGKK